MSTFCLLKIVDGVKNIKEPYGKVIPNGDKLCDVFNSFSNGDLDGGDGIPAKYVPCKLEVRVGNERSDAGITIDSSTTVEDAIMAGRFITFRVTSLDDDVVEMSEPSTSNEPLRQSAFDVLCKSSKDKIYLPDRVDEIRDQRDSLQNAVVDWMEKNKLFFSRQAKVTLGNELCQSLTSVFWYVDGHEHTLSERGYGMPEVFKSFTGYNQPQKHRHRKRENSNASSKKLLDYSATLFLLCSSAYMQTEKTHSPWYMLRENLLRLADNFRKYADHLSHKTAVVTEAHEKRIRRSEEFEWKVYKPTEMNATLTARFKQINKALEESAPYTAIFLNDYTPSDARKKEIRFLAGFHSRVRRFSYTSLREHLHFVWKAHPDDDESTVLQKNEEISSELKIEFPKYFSRAMKRDLMSMVGRVTQIKPAILRSIYKKLTGDHSASANLHEKEIDDRLQECIDGDDDTLIWDLRCTNTGRPEQYLDFLAECQKFISSSVETAVDDRRHDEVDKGEVVTHLALSLSAETLHKEVHFHI